MGTSFIGFDEKKVAIRAGTLGFVCAIMIKEIEDLPKTSGIYSALLPLKDYLKENALYTGYSTSIDLNRFINNKEGKDHFCNFLEFLVIKIQSFGETIPNDYVSKLLEGDYFKKETWLVSNIAGHFAELKKNTSAALD